MEESKKKEEGDVKYDVINDIRKVSVVFSKEIENIDKALDTLGIQKDLPNIAIILNNKLVELEQQFKKAGLSIFPQEYVDGTFAGRSFVGISIIEDLTESLNIGSQCIEEYYSTMKEIVSREQERNQNKSLEKSNPIKKFFLRIRKLFKPQIIENVYYFTEDDIDNIIMHLVDYEKASQNIYEYNLNGNVILSLIKAIREQKYKPDMVPELVEKEITPDLQKLGLEELVPKLQENLIEEYKQDITAEEKDTIKDEDMYLYVPNFNRPKENNRFSDFSRLSGKDDYRAGLRVDVNRITSERKEPKEQMKDKSKDQKKDEQDLEK